ncbi:hypothetical protein J437_LFUL003083 [Ladona fulva]|uniref:BAR domain-containing protein n=1 Tax=Ladona fulva TaxID=123851 RepID=A0A8K0JY65_LADFU|nr:hypothetical protein J437_LFUL003083 [Ladona fulva]
MAWNPLRKNYLTTKPASAGNLFSASEQRDLELVFLRLQSLEENTKRLGKEMKKYCDLILHVYKLENKLSHDLGNSPLCHHNVELRKLAEDYLSVISQLEGSIQEAIKVCQKAVIEPSKRYSGYFQDIAQALHKRDQAVSEWQKVSAKVSKHSGTGTLGRAPGDVLKCETAKKALVDATREVNHIHAILMNELPTFYTRRGEYFHPCLQALARAQLEYYGEMTRLFTYVLQCSTSYVGTSPKSKYTGTSPSVSPRKSEAEFQDNISKKISAIKCLSIVK